MPYVLPMNNFTASQCPCNQTIIEMSKDDRWHQNMKIMESALQILKHLQGEVWHKQECEEQCGKFWNYEPSYNTSCGKIAVPSKLREALQVYGHFYLFKNEEEDSQEVYYPLPQFECQTSERLQWSLVPSLDIYWRAESKKRANLERWIKRAITNMEPTIKNYEKDLEALKSMDASCLSPPASPWEVWKIIGIIFLIGGPISVLVIGGCCLVTHRVNKQVGVRDSTESTELESLC